MIKSHRLLCAVAALALAACHHDHSSPPPQVQVLHASPDAPPVNVLIDGAGAVQNLDYGHGTGYVQTTAGSHSVAVQGLTPGNPTTVIGPATLSFSANTIYTVVAEGPVASVGPVVVTRPRTTVPATSTRVEVLHAAPNAPSVSVYVTAPGVALDGSTAPLGTFAFQGSLGPVEVPAGQYEIRVTPAGQTSPVLFDSGAVTLAGGADLLIAALQNVGPVGPAGANFAPITLGVVDAVGNNTLLVDVNEPAYVRVVHDSADAGTVQVVANGDFANPLVPSLAFPGAFPGAAQYAALTAGTYDLKVTPAGMMTPVAIDAPGVVLNRGSVQSVYAVGLLLSTPAIGPLLTVDDDRRLATQAKLRIVHGSATAGAVDIYLTAPGAGIATAMPTYMNVAFQADTGFVSFPAGSYDVTVTAHGSKTPAIGPATVTIANNGIYTAVARDPSPGGNTLGLILLDDFATP